MSHDYTELPPDLPVPEDDGGADHLTGMTIPDVALPATDGETVRLAGLPGRAVVYCYPMTGSPDNPPPEGWDLIPGARGCTPQSCAFRDHYAELRALGARVFGLSTQRTDYQREAVERLRLPFAILSDADLEMTTALNLPTFEIDQLAGDVGPQRLHKRLTMIVEDGVILKVFYPVFPPDRNAADVIAWLAANPRDSAAGAATSDPAAL